MQFIDSAHGRYRIYASAMAEPTGKAGFVATLIIKVVTANGVDEIEAFRDLALVDGMVWADERDALHYAVRRGHYVITAQPAMLAKLARRALDPSGQPPEAA